MRIGQRDFEEMVGWLRVALPREGCGLLVGRGDLVSRVVPVTNAATDLDRFILAPTEEAAARREMAARGEQLLAIYHSHPTAPAFPSPLDRLSRLPVRHLIIGLGGRQPVARLYHWAEGFREERLWILPGGAGPLVDLLSGFC